MMKLDQEAAAEYRRQGLESMLKALCHYAAHDEIAFVAVYPGGGWALLNSEASEIRALLQTDDA